MHGGVYGLSKKKSIQKINRMARDEVPSKRLRGLYNSSCWREMEVPPVKLERTFARVRPLEQL